VIVAAGISFHDNIQNLLKFIKQEIFPGEYPLFFQKTNCMKLIAALTVALLSTNLTYAKDPVKSTEPATVHIYRNKAIAGALYGFRLKVNDSKVRIKNNHCYSFKLDPGTAKIRVRTAGHKTITLKLEPGKEYYIKSYMQAGMFWNKVDMAEVTSAFAETQTEAIRDNNKKVIEL
jgi:hypothetical protein